MVYNTADDLFAQQLAHYLKRRLTPTRLGIEFTCLPVYRQRKVRFSIHSDICTEKDFFFAPVRLFRNLAEELKAKSSTIKQIEHLLQLSLSVGMASSVYEQGEPLCEQATPFNSKPAKEGRVAQINNQPLLER